MTTQHPAHASADLDVTILGAGHIGFAIALLLQQAGGYRLTVADRDPSRLAEAAALEASSGMVRASSMNGRWPHRRRFGARLPCTATAASGHTVPVRRPVQMPC